MKEAAAIAKGVADNAKVGNPRGGDTTWGPWSIACRGEIQGLIKEGDDEGAPWSPVGVAGPRRSQQRPTMCAHRMCRVSKEMTIGREEILGRAFEIIGYQATRTLTAHRPDKA